MNVGHWVSNKKIKFFIVVVKIGGSGGILFERQLGHWFICLRLWLLKRGNIVIFDQNNNVIQIRWLNFLISIFFYPVWSFCGIFYTFLRAF